MNTAYNAEVITNEIINTSWELWTYDVWGNSQDGFEVNDSYCVDRNYNMPLHVILCNKGTASEFKTAFPTMAQIKKAFGTHCNLTLSGDDCTIYVNRERDDYPCGELRLTSHKSLSPIK